MRPPLPAIPATGPGALGHSGYATPDTLWSLDVPATAALVAAVAGLVAIARLVARRRRDAGDRLQLAALCLGVGTAAVATLSPLHALADALFSVHMVQHLLLVTVATPLAAWGAPVVLGRRPGAPSPRPWALPGSAAAFVVVFTAWHVPALYELAVREPVLHVVEHVTMLVAAGAYWAAVAGAAARRRELAAVAAIGVSGLAGVALGALLALSGRAWYPVHTDGAAAWGLDPLTDQQLGGMIMWVPAGAANLAIAAALTFRSLARDDERGTAPRPGGGRTSEPGSHPSSAGPPTLVAAMPPPRPPHRDATARSELSR